MNALTFHPPLNPSLGRSPANSAGAWAAAGCGLLAALLFFSEANLRAAEVDAYKFDFQMALRLAVCGTCGLYGLASLVYTLPALLRGSVLPLSLFGVWITLTAPLAINPAHALAAAAALWCGMLFAAAAAAQLSQRQIVLSALAAFALFLAGSWIAFYALPSLGRDPYLEAGEGVMARFAGLHHPNGTGRLAALALVLFFFAGARSYLPRWAWVAGAAFSGLTMYLTHSRTAWLAAAAGVAFLAARSLSPPARRKAYLAAALLACLFAFAWAAGVWEVRAREVLSSVSRTGSVEEITSLTGRSDLWLFTIEKISRSPWLGYGYGCPRFVLKDSNAFATWHAHNLILNVALATGAAGAALVILVIGGMALSAIRRPDNFADVILVMVIATSLTDVSLFDPIPGSFSTLWLIALFWRPMAALQPRPVSEQQAGFVVGGGAWA